MKIDIKVPAMGESISEATVGQLLKPTGSQVQVDDEILELETDKVNQVIYAPQAGTIEWTVSPGDVVKVDQVLGQIDSSKAAAAPQPKPVQKEPEPKTPEQKVKVPSAVPPPPPAISKPAVSSNEKYGLRMTREDFLDEITASKKTPPAQAPVDKIPAEKAPAQPPAKPTPKQTSGSGERRETRTKMSKVRQVIAKRLVESQRTTAMLTTFNEVDMSQVIGLREKYKETFVKEHGVRLGFMSFFVKSSVHALMEVPGVNSYIDGDDIVHREYYDIGVAVGTDRGLFVPVVKNCDQLSFAGIEKAIELYAKRAREGSLVLDDLQGGGFTITNGGVYGSLLSTPILNPPQSGILGMHKIMKRPVVVDDQIVIRPMMYIALSYDHRVVDGKEAVTFLVKMKECLEDPARFVLDV